MKIVAKFLFLAAGLFILINTLLLSRVANFTFGIAAAFVLGLLFLLWGIFFHRINQLKWLHFLMIAGLVCLAALIAFLAAYGCRDTATYQEDAVIVLGAGLQGKSPTLPLLRRLEKAVEYHQKNPNAVIVVSGGQGFQETIPEAEAMEKYLISHGVPQEQILTEQRSASTYENFVYSKQILDRYYEGKSYQITLITNDFHIYRAVKIAKIAGFQNPTYIHGATEWYSLTVNYLRECAAVLKTWVMGT